MPSMQRARARVLRQTGAVRRRLACPHSGPNAEPFVPTPEFCRALDREDEYDADDHFAAARDDDDGQRPDGATEVGSPGGDGS